MLRLMAIVVLILSALPLATAVALTLQFSS
jgi:hypothetical protein